MIRFGVNTFIWSEKFDRSTLPLLRVIRDLGFDGVELPLVQHRDLPLAELRRELAATGLDCTFCSVLPPGLNTISDDADVRRRTRAYLAECIEIVASMGGKILAGPVYAPVGYLPGRRRTAEEWKRAVECFQSLGEALTASGITLCIEALNRFESYFLNTTEDVAALCRDVGHPNVAILMDTFHANIEEKSIPGAIRGAGGLLRHIHASENDRGIPGSGHLEWKEMFEALEAIGYDGWLVVESFGFSAGALAAAVCIWRDLAPTAESIAAEGVKFLKSMRGA
jgi:D-psicose/D-tagatose/L-ribulose 3-epimerase